MRSHRTKLRPLFRWLAGLTLLIWLGANVLCQTHCLVESCKDEGIASGAAVAESAHGDEHNAPSGHDEKSNAACETLKSALNETPAAFLTAPTLTFLHGAVPAALSLDTTAIELNSTIPPQPPDLEALSTPVVCLGPAFRSQAPPVLL